MSAEIQAQPHPVKELLQRYAAIFKAAWERRDELAGPKLLADEQAFLPGALALQETPPHPAPRRFMLAICTLFSIALIWSIHGQLDIVAIARGRIVVSDRTKIVQPLETASVKAIHVKDGDRVQVGQLLIELDGTLQGADANRIAQERVAAQSERLRTEALLRALTQGGSPKLDRQQLPEQERQAVSTQLLAEWTDIQAKLARLAAERQRREAERLTAEQVVSKLSSTLPLALAREKDYEGLAQQGFIAEHATQDRQRERIELERDLGTARARLAEALAAVMEAGQQANSYRAELLRSLQDRQADASLKVAQLGEEITKAGQRRELTKLRAPVAGTVQQLVVHTPGGVVTPAQALLVIVPDNAEMTAEVMLENKDIGFVKVGQLAAVKLETFPFTRYGTVNAILTRISADALHDEKRGALFMATLRLEKSSLQVGAQRIRLSPGMNLSAEVKTGRRRVIDFLISPLHEQMDESLGER